jgi:hypothetical protein
VYFYSVDTELKLSHLTTIKQKHNEPAADYIRRLRDTRNRCFNLNIFDKYLANLAYLGLSLHLKEKKIESHVVSDVSQVLQLLWNVKAKPRSLGASLGLAISLGMSATLIRLSIVASHQTTKRPTCV